MDPSTSSQRFSWRRTLARQAVCIAVATLAIAQAAEARTFAWKVTGKTGIVYLVGSVHVLSADFYPVDAALDAAYKDADLLVEELDLAEMADPTSQMAMLSRGMLPSATPLDKVISAETYTLVNKRITDLGLPMEPFKLLKPWTIALMLQAVEWQHAGLDPELGLDKHFYDRAQTDKKTVQGLETTEFQISRFDGMSMAQQERLLAESLKDIDAEKANMTKLVTAWRAGDVPAVEHLVLTEIKDDPMLYQRLLVDRNKAWLPKIEALFARRGHAFVVVGAAHLVGPDGVVAMLRAKGYKVEQL
jgi:uncharacterized protein YbaP (TraB family)